MLVIKNMYDLLFINFYMCKKCTDCKDFVEAVALHCRVSVMNYDPVSHYLEDFISFKFPGNFWNRR